MGGFPRSEPMLSKACCTGPDPTTRLGNSRQMAEFTVKCLACPPMEDKAHPAHQLHLDCNVTTATDHRPSQLGANSAWNSFNWSLTTGGQ